MMVLERILKNNWINKRPAYSLYMGVLFTLIAFLTSALIFSKSPSFIGIATILFTVVLTLPTINRLFDYEEKLEVKSRKFFKSHKSIIDFFIYFFIGAFITLFVLSMLFPGKVFTSEHLYSQKSEIQNVITQEKISSRLPSPPQSLASSQIKRILINNIYVIAISFILSLFYGSGAIFLITLNASIFATTLVDVIHMKLPSGLSFAGMNLFIGCNFSIMFFHMIPETVSYLFAAIAGGVLSKAVIKEWKKKAHLKRVLKDSIILIGLSLVIVILAAIIEILVSKKLFLSNVCISDPFKIVLIVLIILVIAILGPFIYKRYSMCIAK